MSSLLLPSGAHSILKWQLKRHLGGPDTGYYQCPLAPCPRSNPSFPGRCGFRRAFPQVAFHCPARSRQREEIQHLCRCSGVSDSATPQTAAPLGTLQSRRKERSLGRSQVSRGRVNPNIFPTPLPGLCTKEEALAPPSGTEELRRGKGVKR